MRILYVEDNPANVFLVKRVAKMGQHEIINFIDGREAIRKYDDVKPDLVLMDIQLVGETSGLEVVKELRGRGVTTPIIAVTAYAMVGDRERCMEAGCNDYLAKPLPIPRLIEIFQQYDSKIRTNTASMLAVTVEKIVDHKPEAAPQTDSAPQAPASESPVANNSPAETVASAVSIPAETPAPVAPTPSVASLEAPSAPVTVTPVGEVPPTQTPTVAVETPIAGSSAATVTEVSKPEAVQTNHVTVDPEMDDTLPTKADANSAAESPKTEASTTEANG